ncbi:MAG: hypothetical protein EOS54_04540 [Mesorhizobium sp.]|uniref:hypothetical protein n=1 Tax=unclassified Mesorhizobium TaxID=325217 RepID=UPI000F75BE3C|nr:MULTISPECIES: hypothetical protein [unclassified Mesorhizobium]AZO47116.1 hypothetical protein EJ073_04215 [Mesorhizobium sp. M4B.F.Ca.ET.058.02.1.1]RWC57769.1 MAG: hypothetical protein EOS54_04540 [Mesorhizobium sp.]RWD13850.1 MAG: hypothetical protein EOS74_17795 [Mesorhizobium sp.]RWD55564.1 MAG: hypothetical protein EOS75_16520 [Mesorhizobium sp.]TIU64874.1 MAG: hypothetical protein E5W30_01610 [Mesorhizobium sp.]
MTDKTPRRRDSAKQASNAVKPRPSIIPFETRYQTQKELLLAVLERQFQYGKWVLSSLLTVHAGSLLAISQAGSATARLYQACGPLLIYGVATTLAAGGLAYVNFSFAANLYNDYLRDIRHGKEPVKKGWKSVVVNLTLYLTPLVAIASLTLFFAAAVRAVSVI